MIVEAHEERPEEDDEECTPIERDDTVETSSADELQEFVDKVKEVQVGEGGKLLELVYQLPKMNGSVSQGHTKTRILKYLTNRGLLPANLSGKAQSRITKKVDINAFEACFKQACSNPVDLSALAGSILAPFPEAIAHGTLQSKALGNCIINKVALMAHLLVHDLATPLWETVHSPVDAADRPAFLEQTDGVGAAKEALGNQLISVANSIKTNLDLSAMNVENCGAEAAAALKDIDPTFVTFASAKELFALQTMYVNLHDQLLTNLDSSGQSASEGTLERRLKCFSSFIGPYGRNKNLGLFYCFLVWEGKSTRWLSKRLPENVSQKSSTSDTSCAGGNKEIVLSKKQQQQVEIMKRVMSFSTPPQPPSRGSYLSNEINADSMVSTGSSANAARSYEVLNSDPLVNEKKRLLVEKANAEKAAKLQKVMESDIFNTLDEGSKEQIKHQWLLSLLGDGKT